MNNAKITCNSCGLIFESATELERNLNECPQCIEKKQDEMLRFMFGESSAKQEYESARAGSVLVADYSSESPNKILNYHSLIEAIHEYFDPTADHDFEYLTMRINLLRKAFGIDNESLGLEFKAIDELLMGFGEIVPVSVLPFEGALELPESIDTEAHIFIEKNFRTELNEIKERAYEIQRAYITYIIQHSITPGLRSKTVTLAELISSGLPTYDPGSDYDSY